MASVTSPPGERGDGFEQALFTAPHAPITFKPGQTNMFCGPLPRAPVTGARRSSASIMFLLLLLRFVLKYLSLLWLITSVVYATSIKTLSFVYYRLEFCWRWCTLLAPALRRRAGRHRIPHFPASTLGGGTSPLPDAPVNGAAPCQSAGGSRGRIQGLPPSEAAILSVSAGFAVLLFLESLASLPCTPFCGGELIAFVQRRCSPPFSHDYVVDKIPAQIAVSTI